MPNGIKCIRRYEEFTSSFINKNLCPNAPYENKRIRRRRPMNKTAKDMNLSLSRRSFDQNEFGFRSPGCIILGGLEHAKKPSHTTLPLR